MDRRWSVSCSVVSKIHISVSKPTSERAAWIFVLKVNRGLWAPAAMDSATCLQGQEARKEKRASPEALFESLRCWLVVDWAASGTTCGWSAVPHRRSGGRGVAACACRAAWACGTSGSESRRSRAGCRRCGELRGGLHLYRAGFYHLMVQVIEVVHGAAGNAHAGRSGIHGHA